MVSVSPHGLRRDLIRAGNLLKANCTYEKCNPARTAVQNVSVAANILDKLKAFEGWQQEGKQTNDTHTILTMQASGTTGGPKIHLVDVLFEPKQAGQPAVPSPEQLNLVDGSWIGYLAEILQKPSTKIDFFFSPVPHLANDYLTSTSNNNLLRLSQQIQQFLTRIMKNPKHKLVI